MIAKSIREMKVNELGGLEYLSRCPFKYVMPIRRLFYQGCIFKVGYNLKIPRHSPTPYGFKELTFEEFVDQA